MCLNYNKLSGKKQFKKKAPILSFCLVLMQPLGYELNWESPCGTKKLCTSVKDVFPELFLL